MKSQEAERKTVCETLLTVSKEEKQSNKGERASLKTPSTLRQRHEAHLAICAEKDLTTSDEILIHPEKPPIQCDPTQISAIPSDQPQKTAASASKGRPSKK
jgi:hypothetical protein